MRHTSAFVEMALSIGWIWSNRPSLDWDFLLHLRPLSSHLVFALFSGSHFSVAPVAAPSFLVLSGRPALSVLVAPAHRLSFVSPIS